MADAYPEIGVFTITLANRIHNYKVYTKEGSPMFQGGSIVQMSPPWYEIVKIDKYGNYQKEWGKVTLDDEQQIKFISSDRKDYGKAQFSKMIEYMQSLIGLPVINYEQLKVAVANLTDSAGRNSQPSSPLRERDG